jgi:hypothetical protein
MKRFQIKKPKPLYATYGAPSGEPANFGLRQTMAHAQLDAGWIRLTLAWDDKGGELVLATTLGGTFQLCSTPHAATSTAAPRKPRKRRNWAYAVDQLTADFFGVETSARFAVEGFEVTYGRDHAGRVFLAVKMKSREFVLLFRDPASRCSLPWSPRRSAVMGDGLKVGTALVTDIAQRLLAEGSLDVELDELLAELDAEVAPRPRSTRATAPKPIASMH